MIVRSAENKQLCDLRCLLSVDLTIIHRAQRGRRNLVLIREASPLGLPYTRSRAPLRRRAPIAWLARTARSHLGVSVGLHETASNLRASVSPC